MTLDPTQMSDADRWVREGKMPRLPGVGAIDDPPNHYAGKGGMDVFDIIDAFELDFYEGNCIKYLLRHKKKGGQIDLQKARHYLDEIIARLEKKNGA